MIGSGITTWSRTFAEALMDSTCVIVRRVSSTNQETGVEQNTDTTIYSGKCRLRMPDADPRSVALAGQSVAVQQPTLSLPMVGSDTVRVGDIATITSPMDAAVRVARIAGVHSQTHSTARRFPVEVQS